MNRMMKFALLIVLAATTCGASAQAASAPAPDAASFPPFQQWVAAILTGDGAALKALYSTDPPAEVRVKDAMIGADADVNFWLGMKVRSMKVGIIRTTTPRPDYTNIIFRADIVTGLPDGHSTTVTDDHVWLKQGDQWRLASGERTDAPRLKQPSDMKKEIYPVKADARAEIKEAEAKAAREHKRLLLVFGANWCFDCHVLDLAFQQPDLAPILAANYEVVHIDLGPDEHKNPDLVKTYEIPLDKGIPALAVAESDGKLVVSQKNGEFEDARALTPDVLQEFLNKWKPQPR
ncbi:MAG: thioredoxin family protein [Candidatus Sulfotelmatobacter sp.]